VDAYPNDVFEGQVSQVRLGSTNSSSSSTSSTTVVTYEVVITADNPDLKLKPRLTANATIYTLEKENVLTVPNKALRFTPNKQVVKGYKIVDCDGENKVWTVEGKTLTAHAVKIGLNDGTNTEILDGLTANTNIITGTEIVTEGAEAAAEEASGDDSSTESNPFMPTPPGKKKNK
jgi:HlyD family secretion protein